MEDKAKSGNDDVEDVAAVPAAPVIFTDLKVLTYRFVSSLAFVATTLLMISTCNVNVLGFAVLCCALGLSLVTITLYKQ